MKWRFWQWFFRGLNARPGYRQLIDWWSAAYVALGWIAAKVVNVPVHEAAETILLPLAGIFIGLSFAWIGSAQALLKDSEIEKLAEHHADGIESYVYTFQLGILTILVTLSLWAMAGLRVFDHIWLKSGSTQLAIETLLYLLAGLTLRECWDVVKASQIMIIVRNEIRKK